VFRTSLGSVRPTCSVGSAGTPRGAGRDSAQGGLRYSAVVEQRIVAIGGGATGEPLRDYILALSGHRRPKLLWVNTGMAEDARGALRIYDFFAGRAEVSRLEFFPWPPQDLRDFVLGHDIVFVGGGNPANMLAVWRVHGFDRVVREAWDEGRVLAGSSGGMHGWFEACVTDSFGPQLQGMRDGLGFLPGSACAHFDDEELRRPLLSSACRSRGLPGRLRSRLGRGALLRRNRTGRGRHSSDGWRSCIPH
jgi:dipeptidase E